MNTRNITLASLLLLIFVSSPAFAGMEARYWPTNACMLDFKTLKDGNPTPADGFTMTATYSHGSTSLSDAEGNLILFGFQTNLFDQNQTLVTELKCKSGPQTAVLLPWPGEPGSYCQIYADRNLKISYTKVRSDAVTNKVQILDEKIPFSVTSQALTACITPDRKGYYIVSKTAPTEKKAFQVLKLTSDGFTVLSANVPAPPKDEKFGTWSNLKFSTDGRHIAYGATLADNTAIVALYAFDPATGEITHERNYNLGMNTTGMGGVEFSPNGRYLYAGLVISYPSTKTYIFQIDRQSGAAISLPLPANTFYAVGGFQLAPNGDIYACIGTSNHMGHLKNPDLPAGGDGCTWSTVNLGIGISRPGLPVFIASDLRRTPAEIITTETPGILTVKLNPLDPGVSATAYGLCWAEAAHPAPGKDNVVLAPETGASFEADLTTRLGSGVRYHVRAFVRGDDGQTYYGDEIELLLADHTPPSLLSAEPADGSNDAPVGAPLRLTFTRPLDEKTLTGETVCLTDADDAPLPGDLSMTGHVLTFTPRALLAPGTDYTLTLSADITDLCGNALAPLTLTFTTAAAAGEKPEITATNVADGDTGIPANITLMATFSIPMAVNTLSDTTVTLLCAGTPVQADIAYTPDTRTITLVPRAPLSADTECTFTVTRGACSTAGSALAADLVLHFTTAETAVDMDSDGVPDNEENFPGDSTRATVTAVTNTGSFELDSSAIGGGVELADVRTVSDQAPSVNATGKPADHTFPDGLLAYKVVNLSPGETIEIPVRIPSGIPAGARIYKVTDQGYSDVTGQCRIENNTVILTLIDGGPGDADGTADGVIDDPLGVAVPLDGAVTPVSPVNPAACMWDDDEGGPCFINSAAGPGTGWLVLLCIASLMGIGVRRNAKIVVSLLLVMSLCLPLHASTNAMTRTNLNLREGPGSTTAIIMTLPEGTVVEVLGDEGDWINVNTCGLYGWVHKGYTIEAPGIGCEAISGGKTSSEEGRTNLGTGPDTTFPVILLTSKETEGTIPGHEGDRDTIIKDPLEGCMHSDSIAVTEVAPEVDETLPGRQIEDLEVPSSGPTAISPVDEAIPVPDDEKTGSASWSIAAGIGASVCSTRTDARLGGRSWDFDVEYELYPVLRLDHEIDDDLSLEFGARYDWFHWDIKPSLSAGGDSSFDALTFSFGPVFYFDRTVLDRERRLFVHAGLLYRLVHADLDFPVEEYKAGAGLELAAGIETSSGIELRGGCNWTRHSPKKKFPGTSGSEDLDLPGVFFDVTYRFDI